MNSVPAKNVGLYNLVSGYSNGILQGSMNNFSLLGSSTSTGGIGLATLSNSFNTGTVAALRNLSGGTNISIMEEPILNQSMPIAKSKIMKASDVISQQMSKSVIVSQEKPATVMSASDVLKFS